MDTVKLAGSVLFLSTLSLRRATPRRYPAILGSVISIHALLAESDANNQQGQQARHISIHALLAESDHFDNYNLHCVEISIHALLAESDLEREPASSQSSAFLSTLSLRRATLAVSAALQLIPLISIHALLAESDFDTAPHI